jgi:hypothetical protein
VNEKRTSLKPLRIGVPSPEHPQQLFVRSLRQAAYGFGVISVRDRLAAPLRGERGVGALRQSARACGAWYISSADQAAQARADRPAPWPKGLVTPVGQSRLLAPNISAPRSSRTAMKFPGLAKLGRSVPMKDACFLASFLDDHSCPMKSRARMSPIKSKKNRFMIAQPKWDCSVPEKIRHQLQYTFFCSTAHRRTSTIRQAGTSAEASC